MCPPKGVVLLVDNAVAISVSTGAIGDLLAERLAPEDVISRVDRAVAVVVAGETARENFETHRDLDEAFLNLLAKAFFNLT